MNTIALKERVVTCGQFNHEELNFILNAINATIEARVESGEVIVDDPGNTLGRLDHLYTYLSVDDGGENVYGINNLPLVA